VTRNHDCSLLPALRKPAQCGLPKYYTAEGGRSQQVFQAFFAKNRDDLQAPIMVSPYLLIVRSSDMRGGSHTLQLLPPGKPKVYRQELENPPQWPRLLKPQVLPD
jgi:hypothetical protein